MHSVKNVHLSLVLFFLGLPVLLGFTFFSPGLGSEGKIGVAVGLLGVGTLLLLIKQAIRHSRWLWLCLLIQLTLLFLLFYESASGGRLYIGT